jgi:Tfp pilus assembly protein PilV
MSRRGAGRPLRALLAADRGFTVTEALVAGFLLVLGSLAVIAIQSASSRNTYRAEQSQVVSNRLQDELEQIKQLPFEEIALAAAPDTSPDPDDPNSRVSGVSFDVGGGSGLAPLVYNGSALEGGGTVSGGTVATGPTEFTSGDVKGEIYRYVVWLNDGECDEALCPGAQDSKRVIVAIRLDETASGGGRAYQEIHEDVADPDTQPQQNPGPNEDDEDDESDYPWSFWLTDTTCNHASRQPITDDHLTHNTRGSCDDGLETGNSSGAPDLMFPEAPQLDGSLPPDQQPLYDYAEDVEPSSGGTLDKGVQLRRPGLLTGTGCLISDLLGSSNLLPPLETTPGQKIHKWLAPPVPSGISDLLLTGEANLSLWTQTLNGAEHAGRICVYLFRRELDRGAYVDVPLVNLTSGLTHFVYEQDPWPRGGWQKINVPLDFVVDANLGGLPLLPDTRLGVAIRVERSGTGGSALQFIYDHPSFDSRLTVNANQVLPF